MKIYKIYGDNVSGGCHSSYFIVIANSKEEALYLAEKRVKDDKWYSHDINSDWKLDEEVLVEDIKEGVIYFDTGDCC